MPASRLLPITLALAFALTGTACGEQARETAQSVADEAHKSIAEATAEGGTVDKALAEASRKLHEENLKLGHEGVGAKAELTPQGDLLIDGVALPLTDEQRGAALAYRKEVLDVADAGMAIGKQGAALGVEAAGLALRSLFNGGADEAQARIEAEAKKIESAALALCENVEGLKAAQERFASLVPEFAPYAKSMDINADCDSARSEAASETSTANT